jgi:Fic family protein
MANGTDFDGRYPHIRFREHWEITSQTQYLLGKCDALVGCLAGMPLQPEYYQHLMRVSLIKGARATTAIEGNTLTVEEVAKVADGASLAPSKEYLEREVKNVIDAMNEILKQVADDGDAPVITEELIQSFHGAIGKDLGEHFDALPGQYRTDDRVVGPYKCPRPADVPELMKRLSEWLKVEFGFASGKQTFADAVIQAIVTHVYFEWIHPFGDGNGRTGRMLEFYILLRAGNPDIASHILSNFYNETRTAYYRHLDKASKERDLTAFISYAVQGYHDGLVETLQTIHENAVDLAWQHLVYATFADHRHRKKNVHKRRRQLALAIPRNAWASMTEAALRDPALTREYATKSPRTLVRDIEELVSMNLVVEKDGKVRTNVERLGSQIVRRRKTKSSAAA